MEISYWLTETEKCVKKQCCGFIVKNCGPAKVSVIVQTLYFAAEAEQIMINERDLIKLPHDLPTFDLIEAKRLERKGQ